MIVVEYVIGSVFNGYNYVLVSLVLSAIGDDRQQAVGIRRLDSVTRGPRFLHLSSLCSRRRSLDGALTRERGEAAHRRD